MKQIILLTRIPGTLPFGPSDCNYTHRQAREELARCADKQQVAYHTRFPSLDDIVSLNFLICIGPTSAV